GRSPGSGRFFRSGALSGPLVAVPRPGLRFGPALALFPAGGGYGDQDRTNHATAPGGRVGDAIARPRVALRRLADPVPGAVRRRGGGRAGRHAGVRRRGTLGGVQELRAARPLRCPGGHGPGAAPRREPAARGERTALPPPRAVGRPRAAGARAGLPRVRSGVSSALAG